MNRDAVDNELAQLGFEFFFWYARFEAALKANGYLKHEKPGDRAAPSWKRFVRRWETQYIASDQAAKLIALAPQAQIVGAGKTLVWTATTIPVGSSALHTTVLMLNTVRNNLFQGGVHGSLDWNDTQRTRELLAASRPLLDELAHFGGFYKNFLQIPQGNAG